MLQKVSLHRKQVVVVIGALLVVLCSFCAAAKTEVYFSLDDDPETVIIKHINSAKESIDVAMYYFTDREIAWALVDAHQREVNVRVYLDESQESAKYSKAQFLHKRGVKVRLSTNDYIMHNKFAVIDGEVVLTGSYNWTASAGERNDENLLVIDNPDVVREYQEKFEEFWDFESVLLDESTSGEEERQEDDAFSGGAKTININTASLEELDMLWGVGESTAQNIIDYRNTYGPFERPEDIMKVDGIAEGKYEEWIEEGWQLVVGVTNESQEAESTKTLDERELRTEASIIKQFLSAEEYDIAISRINSIIPQVVGTKYEDDFRFLVGLALVAKWDEEKGNQILHDAIDALKEFLDRFEGESVSNEFVFEITWGPGMTCLTPYDEWVFVSLMYGVRNPQLHAAELIAKLYELLGQPKKAIEWYKHVCDMNPDDERATGAQARIVFLETML